jgi:hypothetical protein
MGEKMLFVLRKNVNLDWLLDALKILPPVIIERIYIPYA